MPTINISGSNPNDPKTSKGAAWDAYERSQKGEALKASQVDAAYAKNETQHASQMEAIWRREASQKKQQLDADARMFSQETAQRNATLNAERQRNADRKRMENIRKQAETAEAKRYNEMRKQANEENADFNRKRQFAQRQWAAMHREAGAENEEFDLRRRMTPRTGLRGFLDSTRALHRAFGGGGKGSGLGGGLGRIAGGMLEGEGMALGGPEAIAAYMGYRVAKAFWNAPSTIANYTQNLAGPARPYMDMRTQLATMGRVGGVGSQALEDALMPPSGAAVGWQQKYGLGPGSAANLMSAYGIAPYSVTQGVGAAKSIARSAWAMGLDPSMVAASAGSASTLGITNQLNVAEYLKQLQRVTTTAVSQGMDRAQSISNVEGLLRQATTGSTATLGSGKDLSDLYIRTMQAGTPGARSGIDATDIVQASHAFAGNVGFGTQNPGPAMALASYIQNKGGSGIFAKDQALRDLIGKDRFNQLSQTPGGQQSIEMLHEAVATGSPGAVMNALQPFLDGNPGAQQRVVNGSYLGNWKGYWGDLARQNALGYSPQTYADYKATKDAPTTSATGGEGQGIYNALRKQGWSAKAAADMTANAYAESKFDPNASNDIGGGHAGLFQLGQARQKKFKEIMGFDIHGSSISDQLAYNQWELTHTEKKTGDMLRSGADLGPGRTVFGEMDERFGAGNFSESSRRARLRNSIAGGLEGSYSSSNVDVNTVSSNVERQGMEASKTAYHKAKAVTGGDLGDSLILVSTAAERTQGAFYSVVKTVTEFDGILSRVNHNLSNVLGGIGQSGSPYNAPHSSWYDQPAPRKG